MLAPPLPDRRDTVLTLVGTITEGVEPRCLMLDAQGAAYLLLGRATTALHPGQRVRVTGVERPGTASTCQQGRPLAVLRAEVLSS